MEQALGASKSERTSERLGYRSGYYGRTLITRVGKLELRVPQDRSGRFPPSCSSTISVLNRPSFSTLAEIYVQVADTEGEGDHGRTV
ncbi:transposase [Rhizobium azibense]|uniref:Mutator family transposase n=1 Tax=Rhizobium azibense TaxID=1136135 RepID=A0A4R3RYQ6_9HYPH|nr:transposase [Rhizobium azibense]TCU41463.1 mutator family transposase [Rhizobium azibense]